MPLLESEIECWQRNRTCPLDPWEVETLTWLDDAYLRVVSETRKEQREAAEREAAQKRGKK